MSELKDNHLVVKRNILNEIRIKCFTLQEMRFFSIYLSKINPQDPSTRVVRFSINAFRAIMEFGNRVYINYIKEVTDNLLRKIVELPLKSGGYTKFQLFKRCTVDTDKDGGWYVEIDAHDMALPIMFDIKECYFSYDLGNVLRLPSTNQFLMYEVLKQYEKVGSKIFEIKELKNKLGIEEDAYTNYKDFRVKVLDICQKSLQMNTDLTFTYEPYGKKGRGGKIQSLTISIRSNRNHKEPLTLNEFFNERKLECEVLEDYSYKPDTMKDDRSNNITKKKLGREVKTDISAELTELEAEFAKTGGSDSYSLQDKIDIIFSNKKKEGRITCFLKALHGIFSRYEVIVIDDLLRQCMSQEQYDDEEFCSICLRDLYDLLQMRLSKDEVNHPFSYLSQLVRGYDFSAGFNAYINA